MSAVLFMAQASCGVTWPIIRECIHDYSADCPAGWAVVTHDSKTECRAPPTYVFVFYFGIHATAHEKYWSGRDSVSAHATQCNSSATCRRQRKNDGHLYVELNFRVVLEDVSNSRCEASVRLCPAYANESPLTLCSRLINMFLELRLC